MTQQADWIKEREAIRARLEAATPNWKDKNKDGDAFCLTVDDKCLLATSYMLAPNSVYFRFNADRELVAHAPEDLRRLLAKSEEDERENERLREELALRGGLIEKQSSQATHELTTSTLTPEGPA